MILTPRYLAGVADGVVDIFSQAENEILADIARRIVKTGSVTNTAGWELQKMREAGMLNEETVKQLAAATNKSEAEIQRMLKESYKRALSFDIDVIPADLKMSWTQIKDNPAFRAIMLQGVNNANQLVSNFTKTTAGAAQTAFFNALDVSYLQHITGAQTREEAVRGALKKLAQQGIYKVAYPQDNGGIFYNSVEAAVRRALTTAVNQSCAKLQLANCDMLGTDLVETTAHLGARPSHAVWQGKIFSRSGSTKKYPDFVKSTGYGTGDGLCGWNCRHSFFPYFEGYSTPAYDMGKFDSEENARLYEEEQKQRRYERMVREAKREVATLEAGYDAAQSPELKQNISYDLEKAKNKLRNRQTLLRNYCKENGLTNDYSRTYTAGYNNKTRVKIGNKNTSKKLDNPAKSGIIKARRNVDKRIDTGGIRNDKALTREQVSQVKEYAISLGMPPERIRYAGHYYTSYGSNFDMLYIGYDVMPNPSPKSANSRITAKGSIAHEIVGHRESCLKHLDQSDPLLDEIQASIRAARFAPDLSNVERITLLRDAGERAKKQGITLKSVKNSLNIDKR